MASAQWWTMVQWKQDGFATYVANWLALKSASGDPVSLGVYAGYQIKSPCDLSMVGARNPDPTDSTDMCIFYQNVKPWIDIGAREYWLDASGGDWQNMATLQHSPNYTDVIRFGGEAVPTTGTGNGCSGLLTPDPNARSAAPFVATYGFWISRFGMEEMVDPMLTDLAVMFTGAPVPCGDNEGDKWEFVDVRRAVDDGWIPWMGGTPTNTQWQRHEDEPTYLFDYEFSYAAEAIHRIYDFGSITAIVDFNNDGLIEVDDFTSADYEEFLAAWSGNAGMPGGYLDGDVTGDGLVSIDDWYAFFWAADDWRTSRTLVGVDLGPAWWHPQ